MIVAIKNTERCGYVDVVTVLYARDVFLRFFLDSIRWLAAAATAVLAGYLPSIAFAGWSLPLALLTGLGGWALVLRVFGRAPAE